MIIKTYTKKQYCEIANITEYEFQKRLKNGELKKLGSGRDTLYTLTKKHAQVLIEELKQDLSPEPKPCCGGNCKPAREIKITPLTKVEIEQAFKSLDEESPLQVPAQALQPKRSWWSRMGKGR